MSPLAIPPAVPPPLPKPALQRSSVAGSHSRCGHAPQELGSPFSGGVREARRESTQSDSASYDARPGQSPARASYREQPESFPYVESTPQYTPYTWNWRLRPEDRVCDSKVRNPREYRPIERMLAYEYFNRSRDREGAFAGGPGSNAPSRSR